MNKFKVLDARLQWFAQQEVPAEMEAEEVPIEVPVETLVEVPNFAAQPQVDEELAVPAQMPEQVLVQTQVEPVAVEEPQEEAISEQERDLLAMLAEFVTDPDGFKEMLNAYGVESGREQYYLDKFGVV